MIRVEVKHMVQVGRHRAGLFLPYPTSEHEVTEEQLAVLRKDFRLHVTELVDEPKADPPPAEKPEAEAPKGGKQGKSKDEPKADPPPAEKPEPEQPKK